MEKKYRVFGFSGDRGRYIGAFTSQAKFIEGVLKMSQSSYNWVKERMCETGNSYEVKKALRNKGRVVFGLK